MILAMVMATIFFIPCGVIQAISNIQIGLNVITEFVAAYALAGKPIANMTFKVYGYMAMYQGLSFAQDLKLGHYMHLPPKMMFSVQVLATIWGSLVNVGVLYWSFANITGICTSAAVQNFTCPQATTFFTASVVWGAVGPQRLFERGQLYYSNLFFFLIGAVAPIPIYFLARRYPGGPWKFFNTPIFFAGTAYIPPATAIKYVPDFVLRLISVTQPGVLWVLSSILSLSDDIRRGGLNTVFLSSQLYLITDYVTSAGLDCGLAISLIVIFLCLSLPKGGIPFNWWGNVAVFDTAVCLL
jgi:OPT family oligopeptide transporter